MSFHALLKRSIARSISATGRPWTTMGASSPWVSVPLWSMSQTSNRRISLSSTGSSFIDARTRKKDR